MVVQQYPTDPGARPIREIISAGGLMNDEQLPLVPMCKAVACLSQLEFTSGKRLGATNRNRVRTASGNPKLRLHRIEVEPDVAIGLRPAIALPGDDLPAIQHERLADSDYFRRQIVGMGGRILEDQCANAQDRIS